MKNKIFSFIIALLLVLTLSSCIGKTTDVNNQNQNNNNTENPSNPPSDINKPSEPSEDPSGSDTPDDELTKYTVTLKYADEVFTPTEEIYVIWQSEYTQLTALVDDNGVATIDAEGVFNVYLSTTPNGYTYNPNIYETSEDNPNITIELVLLTRAMGTGKDLYNPISITNLGTYRATLIKNRKVLHYEYVPKESGVYIIESMVNIYDNTLNPKLDAYTSNSFAKYYEKTIDNGGKEGSYTKNFKWIVFLSDENFSESGVTGQVVFNFAIKADSLTGVYPQYVDFSITYLEDYIYEGITSVDMKAEEASIATPTESQSKGYRLINCDGGTGNYCNTGKTNGNGLFDGSKYKYNEETKIWHRYDKETDTYLEPLVAYISSACPYYDVGLNTIQEAGNKNLTVSKGTENYTEFIEVVYTNAANSDGVCYVTCELKEFLQKFSISQSLFFDGNGRVESYGSFALQEYQWLFACAYYVSG